uniref:CSON001496 protein n=1 Tax=Culicoides sonorensis TaxID=179676 RepID=A0A336L139_CULSO
MKTILITGMPGSGKTTIVKKLVESLKKNDNNEKIIAGFYTEEVRSAHTNSRIGFDICDFNGNKKLLARELENDTHKMPKVGKYSVHVKEFEKIALHELRKKNEGLLIVDEIGKMELFSQEFTREIQKIIESLVKSEEVRLVATVPVSTRSKIPLVERLKSVPNVKIFNVTKSNRDTLYQDILANVMEIVP